MKGSENIEKNRKVETLNCCQKEKDIDVWVKNT